MTKSQKILIKSSDDFIMEVFTSIYDHTDSVLRSKCSRGYFDNLQLIQSMSLNSFHIILTEEEFR